MKVEFVVCLEAKIHELWLLNLTLHCKIKNKKICSDKSCWQNSKVVGKVTFSSKRTSLHIVVISVIAKSFAAIFDFDGVAYVFTTIIIATIGTISWLPYLTFLNN
jgi:hypothetical protein